MSYKNAIATAKTDGRPQSDPIDVAVGGELVTVRFTQMDGADWGRLTSRHPSISGGPLALRYGYDVHALAPECAEASAVIIEDGEEITPEVTIDKRTKKPTSDWRDLFAVLDGHNFQLLADAIFDLNEWGPQRRLAELKKASARA